MNIVRQMMGREGQMMRMNGIRVFAAAAVLALFVPAVVAASEDLDLLSQIGALESMLEEAVGQKNNEPAETSEPGFLSREIIRQVQTALNEAGYDCGAVDGIAGARTRAAVAAYAKAHGFASDGQITESILYELGIWDYSDLSDIPQNGQDVQLLKEYTFENDLEWYQYHYLVIRNNTSQNLDVRSNSAAFDGKGDMTGFAEGSFYALGPGCISVMYEAFEMEETPAHYETVLSSSQSRYPRSVLKDLTWKKTDLPQGASFEVTNSGSIPAKNVEGYALFFKDGTLVDVLIKAYEGAGGPIQAGSALTQSFTTDQAYDRVDFYLTGTS